MLNKFFKYDNKCKKLSLEKIISGFQSGADIAGILVAKKLGIETGGYIPKGFKTLDGFKPEYKNLYNAVETDSENYAIRTYKNVKESDATIRLAKNFNSSGEICTLKAIKAYKRPYLDIDIQNLIDRESVRDFILLNKVKVLNVAGNSEQTFKGIQQIVYNYLLNVLGDENE